MKDFTKGDEGKTIILFALPILFGNFFFQLYNFVNSAVVGHFLGNEAFVAVSISFPIIFLLVSVVIGIGNGGMVLVSQYKGVGDMENVRKSIDTSYIFLFFTSIIVTIVGILCAPLIFKLINTDKDVFDYAVAYLRIFLIGLIFMFGFNGISSILRGLGDSKTPLYYLIASNILNLLLSLLFICIFHWDVESSAWATVISQGVSFFALNIHIKKKFEIACVRFLNLQWDKKIFKEIMRIGLPTGMQQSFVALGQVALVSIVNSFGTTIVAAYGAYMRLDAIATIPAMSFSQAFTTFVAQNLGANKTARVRRGLRYIMKTSIIVSLGIGLIFVFLGKLLIGLSVPDPEVIEIGSEVLMICGGGYFIFSIMFVFTGLFRGAGDTLIPMFISLFSLWLIRVPFAFIFSGFLGSTGIWLSIPLAWLFGAIGSIIYYQKGNWRDKVVTLQKHKYLNKRGA